MDSSVAYDCPNRVLKWLARTAKKGNEGIWDRNLSKSDFGPCSNFSIAETGFRVVISCPPCVYGLLGVSDYLNSQNKVKHPIRQRLSAQGHGQINKPSMSSNS